MQEPTASAELARNLPLSVSAFYLSFINQYGAVLVTSMALIYGVLQIILRVREHRILVRADEKKEILHVKSKRKRTRPAARRGS